MTATTSFTPQKVLNAARMRHPAFTALLLDDTSILDDYNRAVEELVGIVLSLDESVLMGRGASFAPTNIGTDGAIIDLNPAEGEILRLIDLDCTKNGVVTRCVLKDIRHRATLKAEYADDTRPVGCLFRDLTNNRWNVLQVGGWSTVTNVIPWAVIKPAEVATAGLNTVVTLPFSLFRPLVEHVAILLGRRADQSAEWMATQIAEYERAVKALGPLFAKFTSVWTVAAPRGG